MSTLLDLITLEWIIFGLRCAGALLLYAFLAAALWIVNRDLEQPSSTQEIGEEPDASTTV